MIGTTWAGRVVPIVAAVVVGVGGVVAISRGGPSAPVNSTTITCDQSAANASQLTTAVSNASNGQTICLTASVSYGAWTGTNKSITLIAQASTGAPNPTSPTMSLTLDSSDGNFTINGQMARWDSASGMSITGCTCATGAHDITLKNFKSFNGGSRDWDFSQPPNPNFVIDHAHFYNWVTGEAAIYVDHALSEPVFSGITVKNTLFRHFSDDGIKMAGDNGVNIINNKFIDFAESNGATNHTDAIQWSGDGPSIVRGNIFGYSDMDACVSAYDGTEGNTITHNVMWNCTSSAITQMADAPGSTVAWNTIGPTTNLPGSGDNIQCGNAVGKPAIHSLTSVYDNATFGGVVLDDGGTTCTPTRNDHNVSGAVTFVGGADTPTSMNTFTHFSDFCIASGAAKTAADDGGQVGVCGGDYNAATDGPPEGEGF